MLTMDALDRIPWKDLTHAFGSAEDVPGLLRALKTADADEALSELFGNIWHQGTVYEATAYAVPFLIDLAADPATPDRIGILELLASIATGSSNLDVHGPMTAQTDFEEEKARELDWVSDARSAVARGFDTFLALTAEGGDVAYAAAHVLAQLPERAPEVASRLRAMLASESRSNYRAGLLLLLGQTGDRSDETITGLCAALTESHFAQRSAAALSMVRLGLRPLPPSAREALIEAYLAYDLPANFEGLPWDFEPEVATHEITDALDATDREVSSVALVQAIEAGEPTDSRVEALLDLLFPRLGPALPAQLTPDKLSPLQARAVRALYRAMKRGRRIFCGHFPSWGLPDTMREWGALAEGREPEPIDENRPRFADPENPAMPLSPRELQPGDRIINRHFGLGTVTEAQCTGACVELAVQFDEEGFKRFLLGSND
jgi:hypothetical protein